MLSIKWIIRRGAAKIFCPATRAGSKHLLLKLVYIRNPPPPPLIFFILIKLFSLLFSRSFFAVLFILFIAFISLEKNYIVFHKKNLLQFFALWNFFSFLKFVKFFGDV